MATVFFEFGQDWIMGIGPGSVRPTAAAERGCIGERGW